MPPESGPLRGKLFAVMVPVSQVAKAKGVLAGEPPKGVTYAWTTTGPGGFDAGTASAGDEYDSVPAARAASPATREGVPLSDNARMERLSGGADAPGPATGTAIGNNASALVVIAVAVLMIGVVAGLVVLLTMKG
jgi:hypothetical protein